jgi:PST family polysaccharide transporter
MSSIGATPGRARLVVRPRGLVANARLALAGDLAMKGSALAVTVIAARALSTHEFAVLGVCLALVTVLTAALDAGVSVLVVRDGAQDTGRRGAILYATTAARLPFAVAVAAVAVGYGVAHNRLLEALGVVAISLVGAASLSLLAVLRAAQNLVFEAWQKLAGGALGLVLVSAFVARWSSATAVLAGLALGAAMVMPLAARLARSATAPAARMGLARTLAAAAPLGAMALATLIYYRAPTVLLGVLGTARATAAYTVASTIAFGLLAVPNAITTGLLSRLAALEDEHERWSLCRRTLAWTTAICLGLALAAAVSAPLLLSVFGPRYHEAFAPLLVLLASGVLIGVSGVAGTWLVASRRTHVLVAQVAASLVVNLVVAITLIPRYGAMGAALATLVTEVVALVWLGASVLRLAPSRQREPARDQLPGLHIRTPVLRLGVLTLLGGLLVLDVWATRTSYGLRVISDAPSYLAIVRDMAIRPFEPISAFLRTPVIEESHATPYTQALAWLWQHFAPHDAAGLPLPEPVELGRFLAMTGFVVGGALLAAFFVWVRRHTGTREAWLSLPALLLLFGPAHVIWAGDLTFHGFLYGGYFPQTLALTLLLASLLVTEGRPCAQRYLLGTLTAAATLLVHPFTGILLAVLLATRGCWLAFERRSGWHMGGWCLVGGFLLGQAWPSYSLERALGEAGVPGRWLIGACALAPVVARGVPHSLPRPGGIAPLLRAFASRRLELPLAAAGLTIVLGLAAWESWLVRQPSHDPLIHSNHLSLYWVEDRWRWPLMLAAGTVGLQGLARLALDRIPLPAFWFVSCFGIGVAGALGMALPVWWRFLLFCQLPLALGVAVWFEESRRGWARRLVLGTFAFTAVFKALTLLALPATVTYFGTRLQDSYRLGQIIPRTPGVVATDPFTSYFVPATTGHRVLVVTKAHVSSSQELADAERGYRLLHRFYMGRDWWQAAQAMYHRGVRYVLIEKSTSLRAPDLQAFSTGPTPLVRTPLDRRLLGTYYYRNNRVGKVIYDRRPYTLYKLDPKKLFG